MDIRGGPDRTADVVRSDEEVVGVGPGREVLHRQEAAEVREIDLHDVGDAGLDELADVADRVRALAGRNRNACGRADARQRRGVFGWHRLLDPFGIVRREHRGDAHRRGRREAAVHLDADLDVRADGVADGGHDRLGAAAIG